MESYKVISKYSIITSEEELKSDSDSKYDFIIYNRQTTISKEKDDWEIINQEIIYYKNPGNDSDIKNDCDISRLE